MSVDISGVNYISTVRNYLLSDGIVTIDRLIYSTFPHPAKTMMAGYYFMTSSEVLQVLQDILEEYRVIYLEGSPITWIRQLYGETEDEGLIICIKTGEVFKVTVVKIVD